MSLTIKWASDEDKVGLLGTEHNQKQVMSAVGSDEQEFYDWCREGALGAYVIRTHFPIKEFPSFTYVVFQYEWKRDENVRANNDAYTRIKLAWKSRDGVRWEADNFVKCVQG